MSSVRATSEPYAVQPLAAEQIWQAYPLVSMLDGELTPEQWSDYAGSLVDRSGDGAGHEIITVQSEQQHIYGLSVCRLRPDLHRGRILEIENFAVIDLTGTRSPARVLLAAIDELARERKCSCISISLLSPTVRRWLRKPQAKVADLFRSVGYQGEPLRLRKCL